MKAMIFAAGLGTRLRPLTLSRPKALIEIKGIPLLEIVIKKLKKAGFDQIIINVHHLAEQIEEFLKVKDNFQVQIEVSDERQQLLDTGGGLKKASWFLKNQQPFLVYNVDILSDIDLNAIYQFHLKNKPLATLAVRQRPGSRFLLMNDQGLLCGWRNINTGEEIIARPASEPFQQIAFSGIHVIDPALFDLVTEDGAFSITNTYLRLTKNHRIMGYLHQDSYWNDLGKHTNLENAEAYFSENDIKKVM